MNSRERFDAAVVALGADLKSLALKNAYGIGLREPGILTRRREDFGARAEVQRGPETVNNWENEKIEELVAQLAAGPPAGLAECLLTAVTIRANRIEVVIEAPATPGMAMRQMNNPEAAPFLPCFMYQLPPYAAPSRLTVCGLFMDVAPARVSAIATAHLLGFVCGDGRQELEIFPGGIDYIDATAHFVVHWERPMRGVFFGFGWWS